MEYGEDRFAGISYEIIEKSPAIALRVTGSGGQWVTQYITKNVSQYGYDWRDFISGRITWASVIHPEDLEPISAAIDHYERQKIDRYSTQYRILTGSGEALWVNDLSTITRDGEGNQLYSDCIISDYTAVRENLARIEDNARQQVVLNDILRSLHDSDVDQAFRIILDRTGKYLDISRVILFEDNADHSGCKAIYEWCNDGISSMMERGPFRLSYDRDIPEIKQDLAQKGMRAVDYGQIPQESEAEFDQEGVIAAAIFAVYRGDDRFGMICFDECVTHRCWPKSTLSFLQTVSKLVSTAVIRRVNDEAIKTTYQTMRTVLDHIPSQLYVSDPDTGEIVFSNRAFQKEAGGDAANAGKKSALHKGISDYLAAHPEVGAQAQAGGIASFETALPQEEDRWFGVDIGVIPWISGRRMLLAAAQDVSEKKHHEEYIRRIAYMDHLTGLPNRYRCDVDLKTAIETARESGRAGYVLFIDMDDFKIVNDGYGHDYGDALLIEFAAYLDSTKLPGNRVFRFGGDEFVILVDPANASQINHVIDGLLRRARMPWNALDKSFYCTVSIGVVRYPDGNMGVKDIVKNADIAMYEAKNIGKNSYAFFSDSMRHNSIERAEMEALLRTAIDDDFHGFSAYFQPYVRVEDGVAVGAEALLRWHSSAGRMILPGEFIPLSEYLGLIVPLGDFVLFKSCQMLRRINDAGLKDFSVSVNVSIRQLQQQDIVNRVESILEQTQANPNNLILEITEGLAATDYQRIQIVMGELRKKGIQIAMDDFGTGYSSLSNMRIMPIDIVKIDRSFIPDVGFDAYASSFVRLITELCHSMGKQVCVEGVETEKQRKFCADLGVDAIQGYFYFRPMPGDALLETLKLV